MSLRKRDTSALLCGQHIQDIADWAYYDDEGNQRLHSWPLLGKLFHEYSQEDDGIGRRLQSPTWARGGQFFSEQRQGLAYPCQCACCRASGPFLDT